MNPRIVAAIFRKDLLSLWPLLGLVALLFLADPIIVRLDLLPVWTEYSMPVILVALVVLILPVFQLDSAAGLTGDWLCRPVPPRELVAAKLLLLASVVYLPRALGAFAADLLRGFPLDEALLDAILLRDKPALFLIPLLLFVAIVTRTFVQGFGVLFGIFTAVFVLPTPFVRPPGPLEPGIREHYWAAGMEWLASTPARISSIVLVAFGFWLVYWRRRLGPARALMALTVCAMVMFMVLPMALMPWNQVFALQAAAGPAPAAELANISLRNPRFCLPAALRSDLAGDTAFAASYRRHGLALWDDEELRGVGPDSVAFVTQVEPRGLPLDWRVKLNGVEASYSAAGETLYSLRPARYITDQAGGSSIAHAWMLPEHAVRKLSGLPARLELRYSLTLLRPRAQLLPADGRRHRLPGVGFCSAALSEPGDRIDVDCFSALTHAAQLSAELNDIPASRAYSRVDLAPAFAQWPYGRSVKLSIASPRLANHENITITTWEAAGHVQKSLTLPGILGGDPVTCPLPTRDGNRFQKANWRDAAPHESASIRVDEGVQLEVLDFGGTGTALLLLPGLGATAHSYDELAPLLAKKHRVVAMTRRGTGYSSTPDFGYDTPRLAQDVLQVMDALNLQKVVLVGHSIAGEELTWLGGHHPDRFSALVYLDAAYDRSAGRSDPTVMRLRELSRALPPEPPIPPQAQQSYEAMSRLLHERGHVPLPQGELIAFRHMNDPYLAGTPAIDARIQQAISAALQAPDYARVKIPALAIYAFADPGKPMPPWYDTEDEDLRATVEEIARIRVAQQRRNIELFRNSVPGGRVLELHDADHYLIQSNQPQVLEAIESFVAELGIR